MDVLKLAEKAKISREKRKAELARYAVSNKEYWPLGNRLSAIEAALGRLAVRITKQRAQMELLTQEGTALEAERASIELRRSELKVLMDDCLTMAGGWKLDEQRALAEKTKIEVTTRAQKAQVKADFNAKMDALTAKYPISK